MLNMFEVSISSELTLGGVWLYAIYNKQYILIVLLGIYTFLWAIHSCIPSRMALKLQVAYDELIEVQSELVHVFGESPGAFASDEQKRIQKVHQSLQHVTQRTTRLKGEVLLLWRPWEQALGIFNGLSLNLFLCTYQVHQLNMEIKYLLHGLQSRRTVVPTALSGV